MNQKRIKVVAYILVGAIAVGGTSLHSDAAGVSSLLPAAGLALSLEEGSSLKDVKASTKSAAASAEQEKKENLVNSFTKELQDHLLPRRSMRRRLRSRQRSRVIPRWRRKRLKRRRKLLL